MTCRTHQTLRTVIVREQFCFLVAVLWEEIFCANMCQHVQAILIQPVNVSTCANTAHTQEPKSKFAMYNWIDDQKHGEKTKKESLHAKICKRNQGDALPLLPLQL